MYVTQKVFSSGSERLRLNEYFARPTKLRGLSWICKKNTETVQEVLFKPSYIQNLARRKPALTRLPRLLFSELTALRKNRKKSTLLTDK